MIICRYRLPLAAALKKAGVDSTFVKMEGGGHGIGGADPLTSPQSDFEGP